MYCKSDSLLANEKTMQRSVLKRKFFYASEQNSSKFSILGSYYWQY